MVWIVAESLAVPVFLLAVWATLGPWLYSYRRAFLAGCAVGAAYLVKYVLLSFLPPLALGFFLMQFAMAWHRRWPQRIAAVAVRCVLVALGFAIVMAAWLFYARWSGLSAINALGLWNTGFLPPKSYDGLGFYFILLTLAALLAVAPLLGLMAIYRPKNRGEWVYFAIVLVTLFWAAGFNAWICWKSNNYLMQGAPFDAGKAMHFLTQRYFLYVTWLALPIAFVAAEQVASSGPVRRVAAWLIGSLLAAAAVLILIAGWVWPAAPRLLNFNSPDIWSYLYAGQFLGHAPFSALLLAVAPASLLLFRPLWPGWRGSATAAVASVAVFGTLAVMGWRALLPEPANWAAVARNMAATLQEWGAEGDNALVVVDRNQIPDGPGYYAWTTMFWMPKPALVVAGTATTRPDGRLDVVYDWPKNRVGYWAPAKLPDTMPSAVFLFSGGPAPAGARVLGGAGWPVKSYFLAPIPAEQRRVAQ